MRKSPRPSRARTATWTAVGGVLAALLSVLPVTATSPAEAATTYDHTYTIGCGAQGQTDLVNAFKDIGGYWSFDEQHQGHRIAQNGERDHIVLAENCTYTFANSFDGASALPTLGGGFYGTTVKVTIDGNGSTFARTGSARYRFLSVVKTGAELSINDLTFSGGAAPHGAGISADPFMSELCGPLGGISGCSDAQADDGGNGGAIAHVGTLRLDGVTFTGNSAGNGHQGGSNNPRNTGGTGGAGGAVYGSPGSWTIVESSTFAANVAGAGGRGADSGRPFAAAGNGGNGGDGGAIGGFGHVRVAASTFRSNLAGGPGASGTNLLGMGSSGGMYGDGAAIVVVGAEATIEASTFIDNGNLAGRGGALYAHSPVTITNSTFQHNGASYGGAISNIGTTVTIRNSDFVDNYSDNTGDVVAGAYGGTIDLANSVIRRSGGGGHAACSGSTAGYADDGANANTPLAYDLHAVWFDLAEPGGCAGGAISTGDAGLPTTPALNGGATLSFAPSEESPLRDAGVPSYCPAHDQRGLPRDVSDGGCDIGSIDHFTWPSTTLTGPVLDPARVAVNGLPNGYKGITQDYPWAYFFSAPTISDDAAHYRLRIFGDGVPRDYETDKNGAALRDLSLLPVVFSAAGTTSAELWVGAAGQWLKVASATPFRVLRASNTAPTMSMSMDGGAAGSFLNTTVDEFSTHHVTVTVTDPDSDANWSFAQAPSCGANATVSGLTTAAHSFAFDCTVGAGGTSVTTQVSAKVVDDQFEQSPNALLAILTLVDQPTVFGTLVGPGQIPIDTTAHYSFTLTDGHQDLVALAAHPTWSIVCGAHLTGPTAVVTSVVGTTLTTTFDCTSDGTGLNTFNRLATQGGLIISNDATSVIFDPDGSGNAGTNAVHHTHVASFYVVSQVSAEIPRVYDVGTANPNTGGRVLLGPISFPAPAAIAHTRIDWGDGTVETIDGWAGSSGTWATYQHPYLSPGKHSVVVSVDLAAELDTWIQVVTADVWDYDSATPVLTVPAALTLSNAVRGESDRLYFAATATDPINGTSPATCTKASGTTLPVGSTTVTCTGTANGQSASRTFTATVRDVQPPMIGTPVITRDVDADGVRVDLNVPFTDDAPSHGTAVCDPASGSLFAQGTTVVVCTATDAAGNTAKTSFAVAVSDGTGPVVQVPSSASASSPDGAGVVVSFAVTAADAAGNPLTPTCLPASGSLFAPGTTTVSCTAEDTLGNVTVATFPVVVGGATVETWADLAEQFQVGGGVIAGRRTVAVKLGGDITAAADADGTGDHLQLAADDDATLDLAGHVLTIDAPFGLPAIGVPASADLHLIDSVGGGSVTLSAHAGAAAIGGGLCQSAGDVRITGVAGSAVSFTDGQMSGAAGIGSGAAVDAATLANWGLDPSDAAQCGQSLDGGHVRFSGESYDEAPTTVSAPSGAVGAAISWTSPGGTESLRLSTLHVAGESEGIAFAPSGWLSVDLQGGASSDAAPGGPLADPAHLHLSDPTRIGYVFGGWRRGSADGPAWSYLPQRAASDPDSQSSFTVYASWIPWLGGGNCHTMMAGCELAIEPGDDALLDLKGQYWRLVGSNGRPGLSLPAGASLTLVDSVGGGMIDAIGDDGAAGIGGSAGQASGDLTVRSADVMSTGRGGAGIGGGVGADGGSVTISGGMISTLSEPWSAGQRGAGVGAGDTGTSGGTVIVHGTPYALAGPLPSVADAGPDAPAAVISAASGAQQYDVASGPNIGLCSDETCTGFYAGLGYPATFHLNGGDTGGWPLEGDTVLIEPTHGWLAVTVPTLADHEFDGWFLDADLTERVQAWTRFTGPVDLYAGFSEQRPELTLTAAPVLDTAAFVYFNTAVSVTAPVFEESDVAVHYRWQRCTRIAPISCTAIVGAADEPTYTPRLADLDRQLRVTVSAEADGRTPYAWTSAVTRTVQTGSFIAAPLTYDGFGGPVVGATLTVTAPGWSHVPQRIDYVWKRAGVAISGAPNASSYVAQAADLGSVLSVAITARGDGFAPWTFEAASNAVAQGQLTNAPQPSLAITPPNGSSEAAVPLIGSTLTAVPGTWPAGAALTYQWFVNDGTGAQAIAGASGPSYLVPSGSTSDYFSVAVTGTVPGYHVKTMTSASVRVPALVLQTPQLKVDSSSGSCTGLTSQESLALGQIVCAVVPDLPSGASVSTYHWKRDGEPVESILGAGRYYLDSADVGHAITVTVTVTRPGYDPVTVTSAAGFAQVWGVLNTVPPVLSGATVVGSTLHATTGSWTWLPQRWTYTWLRDGFAISGAGGLCSDGADCSTQSSYTLQPADAGHAISVNVQWRYDASDGSERERALNGMAYALSNVSAPVALATQTLTPVPTIVGSGKVGSGLTAVPGTWDAGVELAYAWSVEGEVVGRAASLALTPGMVGHQVTVAVTGTRAGYADVVRTSAAAAVVVGDLAQAPSPTLSGMAKVGSTLTAVAGVWDDGVALSYAWQVGGEPVTETSGTLAITPAMRNEAVSVSVTGAKAGYTSVTRVSTALTVVAGDLASTPAPVLSGSARVGTTLSAAVGEWDQGVALTYLWQADDDVLGSTSTSLVLTPAMLGATVTVTVTGMKPGYADVTRTSAGVPVTAGALSAGSPRISTTAPAVGDTVRATTGSWGPAGVRTSVQWAANGVPIARATMATYVVRPADLGKTLSVAVTGTAEGYAARSVRSPASVRVKAGTMRRTGTVVIRGTAKVGKKLTLSGVGFRAGTEKVTLRYQWLANGAAIKGATSASVKLTAAQRGKKISVRVSAAATGYTTVTVLSAGTKKVAR